MAQTTKPMPTYLQNKIKKKVLQVVCDAEEELESFNTGHGYSTALISYASAQSPLTATFSKIKMFNLSNRLN